MSLRRFTRNRQGALGEVVDEVDMEEGVENDAPTPSAGTVPTPSGSAVHAVSNNVADGAPPTPTGNIRWGQNSRQ